MRRCVAFVCALGVAACATSKEREAPAAPPASPAEAAPLSPERARFERFKQGAAADPRADFAREAEAEAERRRGEALARGMDAGAAAVEAEMIGDQLAQLAAGGGCFEVEPDLSGQDDWIAHGKLSRDDFLAPEQREDVKTVVWVPFSQLGAYVVIRLACVVKGKLSEPEPGRFLVEIERVKYLALLSRRLSWWSPKFGTNEWLLRHEQLHLDVAELIAQELTTKTEGLHVGLRGSGPDPGAAIQDFRRRWSEHILEQQRRFEAIESQYDRETRHGSDIARQTEWFARVKRGLGAVRAGLDAPAVLVP